MTRRAGGGRGMKRVIDISEDAYELLLEKGTCGKFANLGEIVANSTPLKQEPTTKNDSSGLEKNSKKLEKNFGELDCISRKAILDELEKWDWQELYLPIHFKQMLDELPSVTPQEPKTGHWKPYLKEGLRYQCSACDSRFDTPWEYCPHCGAKMAKTEAEDGSLSEQR